MNAALMCCVARQAREARDRVAIGVPLTEPLRMRAEGEAWVAIGVPLIEPRPRRKPSPWETPLIWFFAITGGIVFTIMIVIMDASLGAKIVSICLLWAFFMTGALWILYDLRHAPEDIT
ncbi:hypothetical protein CFC21_049112 [Triticum aestivum]|uniref:Uncharacterized protein n=3 Tax=Triticinae TaxID=1648030 RepID=A0A9R1K307_WHEAT|nr:uncharacterized protein LOC123075118 [Triticum aestivum]KAF7039041.1 hypothetical protein CFC21_049112 [Triticum aestivum]